MLGIALVAFFYFVEWLDRKTADAGHRLPDAPAALPGPARRQAAPRSSPPATRSERWIARGERQFRLASPAPRAGRHQP